MHDDCNLAIKIWNLQTGEVRTLNGHKKAVCKLKCLPSGELASASWDKTVRIWNTESMKVVRVLNAHTFSVNSLTVLPTSGHLVSCSSDFGIHVWNTSTWEVQKSLTGHFGAVLSLAGLADDDLASGSEDLTIRIWVCIFFILQRILFVIYLCKSNRVGRRRNK